MAEPVVSKVGYVSSGLCRIFLFFKQNSLIFRSSDEYSTRINVFLIHSVSVPIPSFKFLTLPAGFVQLRFLIYLHRDI